MKERPIPLKQDLHKLVNEKTLRAMDDALEHKDVQGPYDSIEDLMEALRVED